MNNLSNSDCLLDGDVFEVQQLSQFTSKQLGRIVGIQSPTGIIEDLSKVSWKFVSLSIVDLQYATEYGEEPEGGWKDLYLRFLKEDLDNSKHTPEYLGRDEWLKEIWIKNTGSFPLYVLREDNQYRILDGHHRLAGAFYYGLNSVSVILGQ